MSTAFILNIPSRQQSNGETLIRGYVSNYASQAGYINAVIQSVAWVDGAYVVAGNVIGAQQFQNSFPLSSAYTNLIAALGPSASQAPAQASSTSSSIALPVGIAVGATALGVIVAGTAIYLTRQKRRRISIDPNAPTVMNALKNAIPTTLLSPLGTNGSLPNAIQPVNNTNEDYYDPELAIRPLSFQENSHVQTLQKQASLPAAEMKGRINFVAINNSKSVNDKIKSASASSSPQIPHGFQQSASTRQLVHPFMTRRHTLPPPPATEFDLNRDSPSLQPPPPPPPPEEEPRAAFNARPVRQNYPPPPVE
jgi:hypothetical protein